MKDGKTPKPTSDSEVGVEKLVIRKTFAVGFRYIEPRDMFTPMMYLPIERMRIEVEPPYNDWAMRLAIAKYFEILDYNPDYINIEPDFCEIPSKGFSV